MHKESMEHMALNIKKYLVPTNVLDVGSLNVKNRKGNFLGCYKPLFSSSFNYTGLDIILGENVDVVSSSLYSFPFPNETFGAIITGQCFEHVPNPFKLIRECARVLAPGGYFLGVAPYKWEIHRYPLDCWRILPDGWNALFEESKLSSINVYVNEISEIYGDCWGIAKK